MENVVYVIIVSIVVIGCIIILRLYCMVCILQWNWCVSVAYAYSVPSLTLKLVCHSVSI